MPIDLHTHYLPRDLVGNLRRRTAPPYIRRVEPGRETFVLPMGALSFSNTYTDMDARIAFMDAMGVGMQLLSLPGLFGIDSLPIEESGPLTRMFNDDLGALCRQQRGRFLGLAALPFADSAAAVEELHRAMDQLDLIGAILPVNAFSNEEEAKKLHPVLEAGSQHKAHFFVHPGRRPDEVPQDPADQPNQPFADHILHRSALRVQTDIAGAMITILYSNLLDLYPGLTWHIANLGGTFANVVERMDHVYLTRRPDESLPSTRAGRVHVDCASLGPRAIESAVRIYGADKVVLGTDCPIFQTQYSLEAIRNADITDLQRNAILSDNAKSLLQRFL